MSKPCSFLSLSPCFSDCCGCVPRVHVLHRQHSPASVAVPTCVPQLVSVCGNVLCGWCSHCSGCLSIDCFKLHFKLQRLRHHVITSFPANNQTHTTQHNVHITTPPRRTRQRASCQTAHQRMSASACATLWNSTFTFSCVFAEHSSYANSRFAAWNASASAFGTTRRSAMSTCVAPRHSQHRHMCVYGQQMLRAEAAAVQQGTTRTRRTQHWQKEPKTRAKKIAAGVLYKCISTKHKQHT